MPVRRTLSLKGPLKKLWSKNSSSFRTSEDPSNNDSKKPRPCRLKEGSEGASSVVFLKRNELQLGPILGEGGFAQVYGVFQCPSIPSKRKKRKSTCHHDHEATCPLASKSASESQQSSSSSSAIECTCASPLQPQEEMDDLVDPAQEYSVKVIRKGLLEDKKMFQKAANDLVNEAEILSQLEHAHIIQLRALSKDADQPSNHLKHYTKFFLLLDRLNMTLNDRIQIWRDMAQQQQRNGNDPSNNNSLMDTKLSYAYQLAQALEYLHSKRILFRDLKPENIGFKGGYDDHHLILFDFGMARELTLPSQPQQQAAANASANPALPPTAPGKPPKPAYNTQSSNMSTDGGSTTTTAQTTTTSTSESGADEELYWNLTVCGTQRYMSHEVLLDGKYNLKSDVYSWAMVVWELVAEVKPFHYMSPTVHKILVCGQGDRPPLTCYGLAPEIQKLLTISWAHKVSDRISMSTICQQLKVILGDKAMIGSAPTTAGTASDASTTTGSSAATKTKARTPKKEPSPAHRRTGSHSPTTLTNMTMLADGDGNEAPKEDNQNTTNANPPFQRFPTADSTSIPIRSMMMKGRHRRAGSYGGPTGMHMPIVAVETTTGLDGVRVVVDNDDGHIKTPPRRMASNDSFHLIAAAEETAAATHDNSNNHHGSSNSLVFLEDSKPRSPPKRVSSGRNTTEGGGTSKFPPRSPTRPTGSHHKRPASMGPISLFDNGSSNNSFSSRSPPRPTTRKNGGKNSMSSNILNEGVMLPVIGNTSNRAASKSPVRGLPRRAAPAAVPLPMITNGAGNSSRDVSKSPIRSLARRALPMLANSNGATKANSTNTAKRTGSSRDVSKSPPRSSSSALPRRTGLPVPFLLGNSATATDATTTKSPMRPKKAATAGSSHHRRAESHGSVFNILQDNAILSSSNHSPDTGKNSNINNTPSHRRMRSMGNTSSPPAGGHRRMNSHGSIVLFDNPRAVSKENASPPSVVPAATGTTGVHRRMRNFDGSAHNMTSPTAKPIKQPNSAHKRSASGGTIRSINSIARELLAEKKPQQQLQPPLQPMLSARSGSWDVLQMTNSNINASGGKGPSLSDLQDMKKDLKEQLKQFDIQFAQTHGRMPNKAEKEVIRPLYNHYNALKDYIGPLESLKKQLKQYDIQFAQTHGRMPTKSEKEVIRHLYDQYKSLKAEIATYLSDYEREQQERLKQSAPSTTALFSDQRVGGGGVMNGYSFDKLQSFDSDLTPEDFVLAEL